MRKILYYVLLILVVVNAMLYIFNIKIPFNNRFIEVAYGIVMMIVGITLFYLDRRTEN